MPRTRTLEILDFVCRFLHQNGYSPTVRDIQEALNVSSTSVVEYHLIKLRERGVIVWEPGLARSIRVVGEMQ